MAVAAVVLLPVTAPGIIGFLSSVAAGAASGAAIGGITSSITGGNWGQGVLTGAISGAIFGGIGHFGLTGFAQIAAHTAGGAASGAINAEITGGNAGINALIGGVSAGVSQWAGQANGLFHFTGHYMQDVVRQAALGGIMGGATSAALGGKFESGFINGAEMSAIGYTANSWNHDFANWWVKEAAVPGPFGQPMSEWKNGAPTEWGNPMKYTNGTNFALAENTAVYGGITAASLALGGGVAEMAGFLDTTPQAGNIIRIISRPGGWGYRIDKPDLHKPYIHDHFWKL